MRWTAFLALLVGLVAGYLLGRGAVAPARAARPPSPPEIEARPAATSSPSGLAAVLESLPPPTAERGTGTITGRVLAADGSPLEGARVGASPAPWSEGGHGSPLTRGEPPPERTLEELVLARIEELQRAFASRVRARTDAEGHYVLSGLVDVPYWVVAYGEGFSLEPVGRLVKPGATLDFRATPLVDVPVVVLEPDGKTPASATVCVMFEGDNHSLEAAWSPETPNLPLRPGRNTLWATAGDRYDSIYVRTTVAGDEPSPVTIQLKVRAAISGHVLVPAEEAPWSLEVYYLRVQPGTRPDPGLLRSAGSSYSAYQNQQYSFSAIHLQPGTYAVGVGWSRDRIDVIELVDVAGGSVNVDLRLPPPDPKDHVLVHVLDPDGGPVDAASIWARSPGLSGGYFVRRRDGSYWVAHADWQERHGARPATADYSIEVTVEGLGKKTVPYRPEPGAEVTVRFEAPARLEVVIEGYAGSGLEGHLALRPVRDGKTWLDSGTPDLEGRASFPLQPGSYELRLFSKLSNSQQALISTAPVVVSTGENRITLPLPALHTLTVLTRAARVYLVPAGRVTGAFYGEQRPVEDGKAVFEWLPAGRYSVRGYGKPVEVDVPAQLTVRVE